MVDKGIVQRLCARLLADRFGCVADKHAALVHQRNPVAARGLGHVMGGDENRHAIVSGQIYQRLPEDIARHRVHTRCRLVQDQDFGAMDQRDRQRQALTNTQRQAQGQAVEHFFKIETLGEFRDPWLDLGGRHVEKPPVQIKVLPHRQL